MKKLICLVAITLFLTACTNDSTDSASETAAPTTTPAADIAQQTTDTTQDEANQTADGAQVYQQNCRSCHDSGLMGAPQLGNDRYSADIEILVENSINGLNSMPARGGNSSLSDAEVRAAVEYMVEQSK